MKLGLLTAAFPDTPLTEVADWAAGNGFAMLEVACWPRADGPTRRYAGVSHIDCADLSDDRGQGAGRRPGRAGHRDLRARLLPQPAPPRPGPPGRGDGPPAARHRGGGQAGRAGGQHLHRRRPAQAAAENFEAFTRVWPDLVATPPTTGVKIAIENCPMIFSHDEWPGGHNLMYAPATWREIFGYLDGDTLGLNLDPSHLVWQMIDYERVVREFGCRHLPRPRQGHGDRPGRPVRARRDVGRDGLAGARACPAWARCAGTGSSAALYRAGYDHAVVVEHEDRQLRGQRREGQGRVPAGPQRRRPLRRLTRGLLSGRMGRWRPTTSTSC